MQTAALDWLTKHHEDIVHGLADLVAIQSISTDGEHNPEIDRNREAHLRSDARGGATQRRYPSRRAVAALRVWRVARSAR